MVNDMDLSLEIRSKIVEKIIENDFEVSEEHDILKVNIDEKIICLNDLDIQELTSCTIEKRLEIARGISAEQFFDKMHTYRGYRLFDKATRLEYLVGNIVEDPKKHGLYFTIRREEIFRFIMTAYLDNWGDSLATINFMLPSGEIIKNTAIAKGYDTDGTYRAHSFYIEEIQSLNDYNLILDLYECSDKKYKMLINDDTLYGKSIEYYNDKQCNETVRALTNIYQQKLI
jgi:hypothetical protein